MPTQSHQTNRRIRPQCRGTLSAARTLAFKARYVPPRSLGGHRPLGGHWPLDGHRFDTSAIPIGLTSTAVDRGNASCADSTPYPRLVRRRLRTLPCRFTSMGQRPPHIMPSDPQGVWSYATPPGKRQWQDRHGKTSRSQAKGDRLCSASLIALKAQPTGRLTKDEATEGNSFPKKCHETKPPTTPASEPPWPRCPIAHVGNPYCRE